MSEGPQSQPAHHGWAVSQPADRCGRRPLTWREPHRFVAALPKTVLLSALGQTAISCCEPACYERLCVAKQASHTGARRTKMTMRTAKWADSWQLGLNPPKVAGTYQFLLSHRYGALDLLTSAGNAEKTHANYSLADSVMIVWSVLRVPAVPLCEAAWTTTWPVPPDSPQPDAAEVQKCQKQAVFMPDSHRPDALRSPEMPKTGRLHARFTPA